MGLAPPTVGVKLEPGVRTQNAGDGQTRPYHPFGGKGLLSPDPGTGGASDVAPSVGAAWRNLTAPAGMEDWRVDATQAGVLATTSARYLPHDPLEDLAPGVPTGAMPGNMLATFVSVIPGKLGCDEGGLPLGGFIGLLPARVAPDLFWLDHPLELARENGRGKGKGKGKTPIVHAKWADGSLQPFDESPPVHRGLIETGGFSLLPPNRVGHVVGKPDDFGAFFEWACKSDPGVFPRFFLCPLTLSGKFALLSFLVSTRAAALAIWVERELETFLRSRDGDPTTLALCDGGGEDVKLPKDECAGIGHHVSCAARQTYVQRVKPGFHPVTPKVLPLTCLPPGSPAEVWLTSEYPDNIDPFDTWKTTIRHFAPDNQSSEGLSWRDFTARIFCQSPVVDNWISVQIQSGRSSGKINVRSRVQERSIICEVLSPLRVNDDYAKILRDAQEINWKAGELADGGEVDDSETTPSDILVDVAEDGLDKLLTLLIDMKNGPLAAEIADEVVSADFITTGTSKGTFVPNAAQQEKEGSDKAVGARMRCSVFIPVSSAAHAQKLLVTLHKSVVGPLKSLVIGTSPFYRPDSAVYELLAPTAGHLAWFVRPVVCRHL